MKLCLKYVSIIALMISFASCKKDNYAPPGSYLTGRLVYQGDSIQVERNQVPYQLYQYGFGKVGPIGGTFAQNGSYSQALFDGDYKLIIPNGQGPFMWKQDANGNPDSLSITMKGDQTVDLEVTPFYMVRNAQFSFNSSDSTINASFKADKIITDPAMAKDIERVSLYINKTQFVSGGDNIAFMDLPGGSITDPGNITLKVTVPFSDKVLANSQDYLFARVGIKIVNIEDMIFSPVEKVQIK
ncbi:DUF3823 domain-containing protein [Hanamia caeni]|jgi:hypothetical protein|uniref:DUF3823 domain-containing protein n=1 Tax=Hanamia caeni TaxID=2294116 RepID=A0A3M9NC26_9BACT|nr:DUF3823 domain-containing protein [Hanamia caeni]RNI35301.1 DUF3823 domain-containing protein [Hanamia caeni]